MFSLVLWAFVGIGFLVGRISKPCVDHVTHVSKDYGTEHRRLHGPWKDE